MKYTVEFLENKKVMVGGVEKEIKEGSFTDESGNKINATIWRFDKDTVEFPNYAQIAPGSTLDANPWSKPGSDKITLYAPKISATGGNRGAGMSAMKTAQIEKAMDKKAGQIHEAQERSAWMWAKNNAAMLIGNQNYFKSADYTNAEISREIIALATLIYNGEPTEPFTSKHIDEDLAGMGDDGWQASGLERT